MDWRAGRVAMVCLASLASASQLHAAKGDPVVRLVEPERGERRFVAPATIPLEAQAQAAPQRSIVRVEFFSGETLIGETSAAPHAINWPNVPEGEYRLRVRATDNTGATDWSPFVRVRVQPNREPRVRLTEPRPGAQFNAPSSILLQAHARDRDHNLVRVEFYADGALVGTSTAEPYIVNWGPVPAGEHVLLAKAIDVMGATDESRPVTIGVTGEPGDAKLYFIHVDHLNTPRLIADHQQRTVWRWDQQEPFGANVPEENPSGLGPFEFPLRFPGQYFDEEKNLHYNYFRDYEPGLGRYLESDPLGLQAGLNTYAYVGGDPLLGTDVLGLARYCCRYLSSLIGNVSGFGLGFRHCYVVADDGTAYGLYPVPVEGKTKGIPRTNDPRDAGGDCLDCPPLQCGPDQNSCLRTTHNSYPQGRYRAFPGPNSNTYAATLARGCCRGGVPSGVIDAPGHWSSPPR